MFKKIFFTIVLLLHLSKAVDSKESEYSNSFLKIPVATIPSALSQSYAAMVSPDAFWYNPAGNGLLTYSAISVSHNRYLESLNGDCISLSYKTPYGVFTPFYSVLLSGDITSYDENESIIGKFSTSHKVYGFSYSKGFPEYDFLYKKQDPMLISHSWKNIKPPKVYVPKVYRFSIGFTVKRIEERLDTENSKNTLFDAGAIFVLPGHFHLGLSVQNIGEKQRFYLNETKIPKTFRFAVAKDFTTIRDVMNFIFSVDYVYDEQVKGYFNFGFENDISKTFQMRVGYSTREKEGSELTFGIGMNFDRFLSKESLFKGLRFDYSLLNYGVLGLNHRIGFQVVW
jgi:hypothetical protein